MPRRPATFNQTDIRNVIRASKSEGVPLKITLEPGRVTFEPTVAQVEKQQMGTECNSAA